MAFSPFERMVAFRYLRARRQEGFVSVIAGFSLLGIALGVATLIIVMAVMNGFRAELLSRILGLNGHLRVMAVHGDLHDYDAAVKRIAGIRGVVSAAPIVEGQVLVTSQGIASGAMVRGFQPQDLRARPLVASHIDRGSLDDFRADPGGDDTVVIGIRLARKLGLDVGQSITLIAPQIAATPFGGMPRMRGYRIAATFDVGMSEYDSSFIFMPLPAAQVFFKTGDAVSGIEVMADNPDSVPAVRVAISQALGGNFRIYDWQQSNASFFNAVQVERNVMFLILTLIIVVAAFNIISSMIMLVKDKGRDIAILRTMGATRGGIMRIFFLTGASIGTLGTFLGFVLGIAFCAHIDTIRHWLESLTGTNLFNAEIYFLSQLPAKVEPGEVAEVVLMGLGLSFLATLYPSWRAARLDPVEALRYE